MAHRASSSSRPLPKRARGLDAHLVDPCPTGKRAYTSRNRAVQAGRKAMGLSGEVGPFDVYKGTCCGQHHLTTRRT
jgi:hypothetical protein